MSEYIVKCNEFVGISGKTMKFPEYIDLNQEIVRCRDYANYKPYKTYRHGTMNRCYDENGNTHRRDECDFCSLGARREP